MSKRRSTGSAAEIRKDHERRISVLEKTLPKGTGVGSSVIHDDTRHSDAPNAKDPHGRAQHITALGVSDEGTPQGDVIELDFVGTGVSVGVASGVATVDVVAGSAFQYVHNQIAALTSWVIVHGLGGFPNVTVVDSAGTVVEGDISYDSSNQITLTFSAAMSGIAYLS